MRYYLNGAYFGFEGELLTVVGTDGHRLHLANTDTAAVSTGGYTLPAALFNSELSSADGHCILAREAVSVLLRQLAGARDKAILSVSTNHFEIRHGAFRLTTKLVEGEYPNYERIIPSNGDDPIIVGRELLHSALSRVNILAHEKHHGGKLSFSDGALKVSSANEGHEAAQERFAISYAGDAFDAGFNIGYLIDVLGVIDSEEVAITINPGEGAEKVVKPPHPARFTSGTAIWSWVPPPASGASICIARTARATS